jgi:hypothetical protein
VLEILIDYWNQLDCPKRELDREFCQKAIDYLCQAYELSQAEYVLKLEMFLGENRDKLARFCRSCPESTLVPSILTQPVCLMFIERMTYDVQYFFEILSHKPIYDESSLLNKRGI